MRLLFSLFSFPFFSSLPLSSFPRNKKKIKLTKNNLALGEREREREGEAIKKIQTPQKKIPKKSKNKKNPKNPFHDDFFEPCWHFFVSDDHCH
jgi:hypothetical protein